MLMRALIRSKNFYLLSSLVIFFLVSPLLVNNQTSNFLSSIFIASSILICVNIVSYHRYTIIVSLAFALLSLAGYFAIFFVSHNNILLTSHFIVNSVFLLIMTLLVTSTVASHEVITIDTLLGAISGYLLIGLTWSYFYLTTACIDPNSFTYHMINGTFRDKIQHFIYFSFVTLTTIGYGDITPYTDFARALSWLEAVTGQIYLAVWISQLVAIHIAQRIRRNKI
jgi:voltage-gated potassium channel